MRKQLPLISRRQFLQRSALWIALSASLPLLNACADSEESAVVVEIVTQLPQSFYEPSSLRISQGTRVIWRNSGALVQSVTNDPQLINGERQVPDDAETWDSGPLYTGETFSHTFTIPGTYLYTSRFRTNSEMLGIIEVV